MRINGEQMNQLQCGEYIGCCKQTLCNKLRVIVCPVFSGYERCGRILTNLCSLLNICHNSVDSHGIYLKLKRQYCGEQILPQKSNQTIQEIPREINEIPHVSQVIFYTFHVDFLCFLPNKTQHIKNYQ